MQRGPNLWLGIADVAADGLAGFLDEFKISVEQDIEDQLHRLAVVDARQNVHQHAFLLWAGLQKLVAQTGHIVATCVGNNRRGAEFGFDLRRFQQRQHVRNNRARADGLERLKYIARKQLVGVFQRVAERLDYRVLFRLQLGDNHGRRATPHAVGALQHATDRLDNLVHKIDATVAERPRACNACAVFVGF